MTQAAVATVTPQEQIIGMLIGVVQGRCIVAAAELELAGVLAKGPLPVEAIAAQAKADADNVFRLIRALETIGFFTQVFSACVRKHTTERMPA